MNNEEKILAILGQIQAGQIETNNRLDRLETDVSSLKAGQAKLEAGQARLEARQEKLEIRQEQLEIRQARLEEDVGRLRDFGFLMEKEFGDKINITIEAYGMVKDKLDDHSAILSRIERKVSNLETRVGYHDHKLEVLKG